MTPALRRARCCTAGTLLAAVLTVVAAVWNPVLAIPATAAAVILWAVRATYRADHQAILADHEQARRAALEQPPPRVALTGPERDAFDEIIRHYHQEPA